MRTHAAIAAGLLLALASPSITANAISALTGWTGGTLTTAAGPQLYGWTFSLSQDIELTAFGVYDDYGFVLTDQHDVGIFRMSDQGLVTSATIPDGTGGFLDNGFRYLAMPSPVPVSVGDYEILMTMPTGSLDAQYISASNVTTGTSVTWLHSAFNDGTHLTFVDNFGPFEQGMFGPNFQFVPVEITDAVPEPATMALVVLGIAGVACVRRRVRTPEMIRAKQSATDDAGLALTEHNKS